ncbi:MAG TPA: VacB/RNase II family 3'-5' exoribonuclease [Leptospiraceae bacterium]|nr:VacB/RNase II family 3'-5' exoribonuclease [Leptospiraceae bacterium]
MSTASRLLRYLEQNAGRKLPRKEVLSAFSSTGAFKAKAKSFRKSRQVRGYQAESEVDVLLAELKLLNLVRTDGNKIIPASPFAAVAKASLSPSGAVFGAVRGADPASRDLFIPAAKSMNALTGDLVLVKLTDKTRDRFEGEVIEIREKARELYRMKLLSEPVHRGIPGVLLDIHSRITACLATPRLPADLVSRMKQDVVVVVRMPGKTIMHMGLPLPEAEFVRFESDTDMDPDYARVLMKHNLDPVYPEVEGLPEYDQEASEVKPENVFDWNSRIDLRDLYTVTIDGPDSKDFDDAISLKVESPRLWKLYVHIADVSHYVRIGTDLDREAARRATSVYLANRVVPMLPPVLSENFCSLIAERNRLAFTCEMDVRPDTGEILKYQIYKSVIRVDKRLTYDLAETMLDESDSMLGRVWSLAKAQKAARLKAGRIDFDMREPKVIYDAEGRIKEVLYRERLKSSMLIEECMLSANICTAEFQRKKEAHTLFRVHEPMDDMKLEALNHFLKIYGINLELPNSDPENINHALKVVHEFTEKGKSVQKGSTRKLEGVPPDRIFQMLMLRSFMQAKYMGEPLGHYGLGFRDYCHFTSPIRRYPDLVVHRALQNLIQKKKHAYTEAEISELGFHTSEMERKAMDAERDIWKLKMLRSIERSGQKSFRGFITGFRPDRVFLELTDVSVEAIVLHSHLTRDMELILPDPFSAYIKKLSRPAFLGEVWNLELERLDVEEMRLFVKPVW